MKRRRPSNLVAAETDALVARTGEHCSQSGWWLPAHRLNDPSSARFLSEGSIMPAFGGSPTLWLPALLPTG